MVATFFLERSPLPKILHTLFDGPSLGVFAHETFELAPVDDCRLWRSFINDVYRVRSAGRCFWLRLQPAGWRTEAQTQDEIDAVLAIGAMAAQPVACRSGGYLAEVAAPEGRRVAVLLEHAPGGDLDFLGADRLANSARYGETTALLHDGCDRVPAPLNRTVFDLTSVVSHPATILMANLSEASRPAFARVVERLDEAIALLRGLTTGFCHGDLNSMNLQFDGDAGVAIDFDCCAWGWRAFELAGFARGVAWRSSPGDEADRLIAAQLEGYRRRRPIAPADLAALPVMLMAQRLWVSSLHLNGAGRWGAINFDQPYAERALTWLQTWLSTLEAPPSWAVT
jgi:Ser/Thr protein kinase RdoA (MazF antagonist)